ncbi:hypothetical protein D0Z07_3145 [Hyphodiscus hymeniophilus]|uniref:Uncharacterized protein n=1 Tax=Hyphodiscus hymeniophilus TaxID=353542 RepID=A0A9P7AYG4_9HELO|nr:hypothetical protein D0Z07_3145 [Hyphodiscus hymeniophilus]
MAPLPSVTTASLVIGFISFGLTLAIWAHAFWDAFQTIGAAQRQVRDTFSPLRQGLYEEREYLKRKRRRENSNSKASSLYVEGGPTRIMNDAVKDLIKEFKDYEAPFLITRHEGREKELEWSFDATQRYYRCGLWDRVRWLRSKGRVMDIAVRLQYLQTRRIAVEVTEQHFMVADMMGLVRDTGDRLTAIERRLQMSRIG